MPAIGLGVFKTITVNIFNIHQDPHDSSDSKYFNTSFAQSLQFVDVSFSCAISVNVGASQMLLSRLDI